MEKKDCYYLGKITKKHGFKGNLIFHLDTDEPELYEKMEAVFVDFNGSLVPFFFEFFQTHGANKFLGKFEDMTPDEAEKLIGKSLYMPLETLPTLEGNAFYFHEIIGFTIIDKDYGEIGKLSSVNDAPVQALFEINLNNKKILIPVVEEWIVEVDRDKQTLLMDLPEGILDLN